MEEINLGIDDISNEKKMNVNFGPGIELLMNDKRKSSSDSVNIDLGELDMLEKELNDLSSSSKNENSSVFSGLSDYTSSLFGLKDTSNKTTNSNDNFFTSDSKLGNATMETVGNSKTWDGYSKINEIPSHSKEINNSSSEREKRRKKRMMIKKLEEWYENGKIKNKPYFNLDSDYQEIEDEYETALEDKRRKDSVKLQQWWFMTFVNSLEYANSAFNPFDINLDGWGEQVSEDIESYDEIFSELHDKYKGAKLSPEISLLLRLGFSAAVVNFTNKALSTATPGFNDVIKQSPELMKLFTNATVNTMSQQSPGFSFASNLMNGNNEKVNSSYGPPPPPVETKNKPPPPRQTNRQDIDVARGSMFREKGIDIQNNYENASENKKSERAEMKGPQNFDIDNILSGLKTKTINIHQEQPSTEDDSMISISSLKDLQNSNMPKRSNKRKIKNEKTTIALDI